MHAKAHTYSIDTKSPTQKNLRGKYRLFLDIKITSGNNKFIFSDYCTATFINQH